MHMLLQFSLWKPVCEVLPPSSFQIQVIAFHFSHCYIDVIYPAFASGSPGKFGFQLNSLWEEQPAICLFCVKHSVLCNTFARKLKVFIQTAMDSVTCGISASLALSTNTLFWLVCTTSVAFHHSMSISNHQSNVLISRSLSVCNNFLCFAPLYSAHFLLTN